MNEEQKLKYMAGLRNRVVDGVLHSPLDAHWSPQHIDGSSFTGEILKRSECLLEEHGDFLWLKDMLTGDEMTAKGGLEWASKYVHI